MKCIIDNCERSKMYATGLCPMHHQRSKRGVPLTANSLQSTNVGKECLYEFCNRPALAKERCRSCYRKDFESKVGAKKNGKRKGEYSKNKRLNRDGYVVWLDPESPHSNAHGVVREHRQVMGDSIGRPLFDYENVHHKNGDRADNRLENLELWSTKQPPGQRVQDKLQWARELIALYDDGKVFVN